MLAKFIVGTVKVILGVSLALVLLSFVSVAATRYFMARLAAQPARPTFSNDTVETLGELGQGLPPDTLDANSLEAVPAVGSEAPTATLEMPPDENTTESSAPTDDYTARVTQPIGLIIRSEPNRDAPQITGVEYDQTLTVVGKSDDGEWLQVRLSDQQEGWVKSGNTTPVTP